jgi:4-nitrophenyl phosphatase
MWTPINFTEVDLVIFDLDGVLYRGAEPIESAPPFIEALQARGIRVAFNTNNSSQTRQRYHERLRSMGVECTRDDIFTSANLAAQALALEYSQGLAYVVGEEGLQTEMKTAGFELLNETMPELEVITMFPYVRCDVVVVGLDTHFSYGKLRAASTLISQGAHFYASNTDATLPAPGGYWPGAGTMVAAISTAVGKSPERVFGKPAPDGVTHIVTRYRTSPARTVMVGDRLETDIAAGNRAGVLTLCVGTGVAREETAAEAVGDERPHQFVAELSLELLR